MFGGIQRWGRACFMLRHSRGRVGGKYDLHCHKGGRMLSFHNVHRSNLNTNCTAYKCLHCYIKQITEWLKVSIKCFLSMFFFSVSSSTFLCLMDGDVVSFTGRGETICWRVRPDIQ